MAAVGRARRARRGCRRVGGPARRRPRRRTRWPTPRSRASRIGRAREEGAEISPDGKFVAFLADRDGEFDLWLSQVGTGRFSQSHARTSRRWPPADSSSGNSAFPATVRRSGSIPGTESRRCSCPDRRHATGVPSRRAPTLPPGLRTAPASSTSTKPTATIRCMLADRIRRRRAPDPRARHAQEHQSGLVTGRPVDLLRPRIGAAGRDGNGRVAPSSVGRIAGASDRRSTRPSISWRRSTRARCSTWRARRTGRGRGSGRSMSRRKVSTPGAVGRRSIHVGVGQPRRPAHRRHRRQPQREPVARAAARSARRRSRRRSPTRCRCRPGGRSRRASAATSLFYLSARGTATDSGRSRTDRRRKSGGSVDGALSEPPAVSPDGSRVAVVVRQEGKRHLSIMSADGTNAQNVGRRPSKSKARPARAPPTGRRTGHGS